MDDWSPREKAAYLIGFWHSVECSGSQPVVMTERVLQHACQVLNSGVFNPIHLYDLEKAFDEVVAEAVKHSRLLMEDE